MSITHTIDVRGAIDAGPFGRYQKYLLSICCLIMFVDGFDTGAISAAAPYLARELGLQPSQLGIVFAAATLAGALAGFFVSQLADRVGRRPLMVACLLVVALLCPWYAVAETYPFLLLLRVIAGFVLAVLISSTFSYAADITPKRLGTSAVMFATCGFGLGVAFGGVAATFLAPEFGWRSLFYFGGAASLVLAVFTATCIPESVRFLALRKDKTAAVRSFLRSALPHLPVSDSATFTLDEEKQERWTLGNLLAGSRAVEVPLLWLVAFFINLNVWFMVQWLPTMVSEAGASESTTSNTLTLFKVGGILGSFICAFMMDRGRNPFWILVVFLFLSAASFYSLQGLGGPAFALLVAVFACGLVLSGPQYAVNGLLATIFPTYVRAAGLGMTGGISRLGAMTGPLLVGYLLQAGLGPSTLLKMAALPMLFCSLVLLFLALKRRRASLGNQPVSEGGDGLAT
ncbi:MAG TPA: MFS transporter [Caulobacteraceae bacterium]|nr:MFS transporter [Caulobacteraceae bacterium]